MIRCAIIGRGYAATVFHQPLIAAVPGLELKGLYGSSDAGEAIAGPAVDLIVIAAPNATHSDLARAAIRRCVSSSRRRTLPPAGAGSNSNDRG